MKYRLRPRPRLWFEIGFDARELARRLAIPTQVILEESMLRDTTRARVQVMVAVKAHKRAVDALEKIAQILTDMDARTGKRDPTKRRPRVTGSPRLTAKAKRQKRTAAKASQRRKGGP